MATNPLPHSIESFCDERGISLEVARALRWSVEGHWLCMPVYDLDGELRQIRRKNLRHASHKQEAKYDTRKLPGDPQDVTYKFYHAPDLRQAIADTGGRLLIANGEPAVAAMLSAGIANVCSIGFGEGIIPPDLVKWLTRLGVITVLYAPDRDKQGTRGAARVHDALADTAIGFDCRQLPDTLADKADLNDLWQAVGFDAVAFASTLQNLAAFTDWPTRPSAPRTSTPERTSTGSEGFGHYPEYKAEVQKAVESRQDSQRSGRYTYYRCPVHQDEHPSFRITERGIPVCSCGIQHQPRPWEVVARALGLPDYATWRDERYPRPISPAGPSHPQSTTATSMVWNIPSLRSDDDRQPEPVVEDRLTCKFMTCGFRQLLMAGFDIRDCRPLLIELLIENPWQTAGELARKTDIGRANISHILNELVAEGVVQKEKCLPTSPLSLSGDVPKHNSKRGPKGVVFSVRVPTTAAEWAVWVAYFERRWRKYARAPVGQDDRTSLELIREAGVHVEDAQAMAAARARIDPSLHDRHTEREIKRRVSYLHGLRHDTSLAAVIPTNSQIAYTTASMKEHFEAHPLASKKEHSRALGVSVDNLNACIRRHGFEPHEHTVEEIVRAGDLKSKLPALQKMHHARVIACRGEFGGTLTMPTLAQMERMFDPDEQVTLYLRAVNTYTFTGVCQHAKKKARPRVPVDLDPEDQTEDTPETLPKARPTERPVHRRFRIQYGAYVRHLDDETGVLGPIPHGTPLPLIAQAWADGSRRILSTEYRVLYDRGRAQEVQVEEADRTPPADEVAEPIPPLTAPFLEPSTVIAEEPEPDTPLLATSTSETVMPTVTSRPRPRSRAAETDSFPYLKYLTAPAGSY